MTRTMDEREWALLLGKHSSQTNNGQLLDAIITGHYRDALTSQAAVALFGSDLQVDGNEALIKYIDSIDTKTYIQSRLSTYLSTPSYSSIDLQFNALCIGIACLYAFLQTGWTGPLMDLEPVDLLPQTMSGHDESLRKKAMEMLVEDGEEVYSLTPRPLFLVFARTILVDCCEVLSDLKSISWWRARCLLIQQKLLDNPAETLRQGIIEAMEQQAAKLPELDEYRELHARFNLEFGLAHHYYQQNTLALPYFESAQKSSNLKWTLTGALGKRTKFQENDIAQLVVMAESAQEPEAAEEADVQTDATAPAPKTLALNDDTLLETVQFAEMTEGEGKDAGKQGNLKVIDQCILLAFCLNVKNTNPLHGLTTEEMFPYVRRVLENPNNWMTHTMALLLRTRLESSKSRTVERAALQLQALVDQFPLEESTVAERMLHLFSIELPPKWELERELGERFVSIGVTRSALEIFTRLEMWEDVISCYQMLEQPAKAESIVRERLQVTPNSPKLHCILGDLKGDPSLYEKAWKLSDGRYARAMRSLGAYYFKHAQWTKSIECYHRALSLNSLFENSWFVMGCAAMRCEDWEVAIKAFSRVTSLDHENGEAWTNLASVYVKLGKKREAWRALREAVKQYYDNSKIWENYLFVSVDLGEFGESILAMTRVLELRYDKAGEKNSVVDVEILSILVDAVTQDLPDATGQPGSKYTARLSTLLNSITEKISNDPDIFSVVGRFYRSRGQYRKALELRMKAYRCLLHHPNMNDDEVVFGKMVEKVLEVVEALVEDGAKMERVRMSGGEEGEEEMVCKDWKYQARMVLKTVIGRTRDVFEGHPKWEGLRERLAEVGEM